MAKVANNTHRKKRKVLLEEISGSERSGVYNSPRNVPIVEESIKIVREKRMKKSRFLFDPVRDAVRLPEHVANDPILGMGFTKSVVCDTRIFKKLDQETSKIFARINHPKEPITLDHATTLNQQLHQSYRSGSIKTLVEQEHEEKEEKQDKKIKWKKKNVEIKPKLMNVET